MTRHSRLRQPLRWGLALAVLMLTPDLDAQTAGHDSSLPIEITADTLEVLQAEQVATFTGNVDAIQGDMVLKADKLRVHYGGDGDGNGDGGGGAAGGAGDIQRIEAIGNVFLSSARETAEGDAGVYDVAGGMVTLDGNVVLTRDDNVIRGAHLDLDLATGRSQVTGSGTGAAGAEPSERVRAIFTSADEAPEQGRQGEPGGAGAAAGE